MPDDAPLLRRRLLAWILLPLPLLLLGGALIGYLFAERLATTVYDRQLLQIANELSLHIVGEGDSVRLELAPPAQRLLLLDPQDEIAFRISDAGGAFLAGDAALAAPDRSALHSTTPAFYSGELRGEPVRVVAVRAGAAGASGPPFRLVQVAETVRKRETLVGDFVLGVVLPQFLLIAAAAALVWLGVTRGLAPLRRLRAAVESRSHLDLTPIDKGEVPGEVRPVLDAVNALMVRLDQVLNTQARFIADAAHQLRTPVAGLKTTVELALRENELPAIRRALGQTRLSVDRLAHLVAQLLSLARNEPSSGRYPDFVLLDLNSLAFKVTMEWVPEAYRNGVDLGFEEAAAPVMIEGDPARLSELLNNLLDNAVRYTGKGGRVTMRVAAGPEPAFSISDDGPRIPPEERERVFERFHRLLGTPTGSGLGLAIVREIASAHGARIGLIDDADGIGNRFTVSFPAPANASQTSDRIQSSQMAQPIGPTEAQGRKSQVRMVKEPGHLGESAL